MKDSSMILKLFNTKLFNKLFKFSLIGLSLNTGSIIVGMFLLGVLKTPLYPTYISLYIIVVGISYILNAKFTFNAVPNRNAVSLYYMNYFFSFLLSILLLNFFRENLDWENYIIGVLPMPFVVIWNFTLTHFIFKLKN